MIQSIQKNEVKEVLPLLELMYNIHQVEIPYFMNPLESLDILEDRLMKMIDLDGFYQFVYKLEDKIIAYMDISKYEAHIDLLFPTKPSIILDTLIVHPDYRGQHFAEEMIEFARQHAKSLGFATMELHALTAFKNLNKYYQKHGFKNISNYMTCKL
ncbi:MAG: GNAT family N-acetyltransferase [Spirochaetota bacterium]|nr:GNAT family N-acetyltransferase [Spirochaetota bacterium]